MLITPEKNEEQFLQKVADSIIKQSLKPILWIIADDGSTDRSPDIIKDLNAKYNWIIYLRLPNHPRDITSHYSYVCKKAFDFAFDYCFEHGFDYEYVGLLDADTFLEVKYFERLIQEFERDESLGIASGCIIDDPDGNEHLPETEWINVPSKSPNKYSPRGTGRLWRKECFIDTDGYIVEPSPDTISNIKALSKGWKISQFDHIRAIQLRPTSSAEGIWRGYAIRGEVAHYINKPFILVIGGSLYFSLNRPHFQGLSYLYGYILAVLKRNPKLEDEEVNRYWKKRILSIFLHS